MQIFNLLIQLFFSILFFVYYFDYLCISFNFPPLDISSSDLNSVEVIGGGLRIPYFVKTIETKLHQKLSHSLPSSSAIAEGATLLLDKEMNIIDNDFIEVKSSLSQEEKNVFSFILHFHFRYYYIIIK